jgi:hypothetical protein
MGAAPLGNVKDDVNGIAANVIKELRAAAEFDDVLSGGFQRRRNDIHRFRRIIFFERVFYSVTFRNRRLKIER